MKRRGSGVSVFELAFEHTEDILKTLVMFDICTDVHFDSHMSAGVYSGHFCFGVTSLNPL